MVIDVYDILQSKEDKATVPIYYEARLAKIDLKPEERPKIDPNFEEVTEDAEESTKASCLLYTSPSPRDRQKYRMPSSA